MLIHMQISETGIGSVLTMARMCMNRNIMSISAVQNSPKSTDAPLN